MMELDEGSKVVITSPNFPDTYSPNSQCDWQFKGAPGRRVGIKVVRLDTENKAVSCMYSVKRWRYTGVLRVRRSTIGKRHICCCIITCANSSSRGMRDFTNYGAQQFDHFLIKDKRVCIYVPHNLRKTCS